MRYFRKQSDEAVLISQMDIWEVLLKNQTIVIFLLQVLTKQHNDFVVIRTLMMKSESCFNTATSPVLDNISRDPKRNHDGDKRRRTAALSRRGLPV